MHGVVLIRGESHVGRCSCVWDFGFAFFIFGVDGEAMAKESGFRRAETTIRTGIGIGT